MLVQEEAELSNPTVNRLIGWTLVVHIISLLPRLYSLGRLIDILLAVWRYDDIISLYITQYIDIVIHYVISSTLFQWDIKGILSIYILL